MDSGDSSCSGRPTRGERGGDDANLARIRGRGEACHTGIRCRGARDGAVKVLQLSTHSTLAPRHGGQLRSHHIGRCLELAGFDVSRVAVCWQTEHDLVDKREPIIDYSLSAFWASDV